MAKSKMASQMIQNLELPRLRPNEWVPVRLELERLPQHLQHNMSKMTSKIVTMIWKGVPRSSYSSRLQKIRKTYGYYHRDNYHDDIRDARYDGHDA